MSNWYKYALEIDSYEDRNLINDKIHFLEEVADTLSVVSQMVFQDAYAARSMNFNVANDKKLSSYPEIRSILLNADQRVLDSPWNFASLCQEAQERIINKISSLKKQREEYVNETLPDRMKGWVDDAK